MKFDDSDVKLRLTAYKCILFFETSNKMLDDRFNRGKIILGDDLELLREDLLGCVVLRGNKVLFRWLHHLTINSHNIVDKLRA